MFIRHIKLKYLLLIGVMTFQIEAEQNQNYTNNNNQQSEQNIQQVIQQSKFNTNNINSQIQNNQQPNSNNNQQLQTTQSVASSTIQSSQTIPQSISVTTQNSNNNQQLQRNTNQVNNTQIVNSNDNIKKIEEIFNFAIEKFLMKKDNKEFYKFHGLIYKYVKKQLDNGINLETIDNAWKNILRKYEGNQNILNIKSTYNLSSITNIINYYIDMLGENRRNLILNSNGPNEFTQNLIKIIELLIGDKEKLLKNDLEKMFKIIFINNKQEILNKLIGLHQVSSNESINLPYGTSINIIKSPLFINDLYNQISNLKNLEELIAYYNNLNKMNGNYVDSEYYINNLINNVCQNNKIEFDSDIDYMIYYINTNNIWAIKLILEFVQDGIEAKNNLPDRDYNNLGIILETMQNSKNEQYSNKINSIQNNEKYIKIMGKYKENKNKAKDQIAENKNSIISETNNIINKIANTSDTNRVFVRLYGDFCKQLHSLYSYVKDFAYKDREELLGDTIKQIWNQNNQSTIQKLINALESDIKACQNNKDINQFKSFLNFLNNDQFKNSTQFSQFNQIRQYYTSNY